MEQVKKYSTAVQAFIDKYHFLPGDMPDAGKSLPGCSGQGGGDCNPYPATAGDGIVGNLDLSKSWKAQAKRQTTVPATSAADESVLFWSHLYKTDLISGVTDDGITGNKSIAFGATNPAAKIGGGFIVGHLDGKPLPLALSPRSSGIKGTVVLLVSDEVLLGGAELNEADKQLLLPLYAAQLDRKMDDGRSDTGYVQAYGSPDCFYSKKNETFF